MTPPGQSWAHGVDVVCIATPDDRHFRLDRTNGQLELYKMSAVRAPVDPARGTDYTMPGGSMTLSADGDDPASGVLWLSMPVALDANNGTVPGPLIWSHLKVRGCSRDQAHGRETCGPVRPHTRNDPVALDS